MSDRRAEWVTFAALAVPFTVAWVWICWIGRQVIDRIP